VDRDARDRWIVNGRPDRAARHRLFCFPYAGGGASVFRSWGQRLPAGVHVAPVQLAGRETRVLEPPVARLSEVVATLADVVGPHLDVPYALFGHSMGALIAFELAREVVRRRLPGPRHLFVSGFRSPDVPNRNRVMHSLPDAEFVRELAHYNGTPRTVLENAELMELLLPALRADFALHETYVYARGEPLDCRLSIFGGTEDPMVSCEELLAWQDKTRGEVSLRMFAGDHFFVNAQREQLLGAIAAVCTAAAAARP
jgi:surfactin synthase thioesterase subunit